MLPLNVRYVRFIRKAIPYIASTIASAHYRESKIKTLEYKKYWDIFSSKIYSSSFLQKIKVVVSIHDKRVLLRLFSLDDEVIHDIFERKVYEVYDGPKKGEIVIDAGAHIGLFSIRASQLVGPKGLVIAIEPYPDNFNILLRNIKLNSLKNVIPLNVALSNREGRAKLYIDKKTTAGHSIIKGIRNSISSEFILVPSMTLDSLVKKLNLNRIDFIKIDVEGAEYLLLQGAREVLSNNEVRIAMEAMDNENIRKKCTRFLQALGFKVTERKGFLYAWKKM